MDKVQTYEVSNNLKVQGLWASDYIRPNQAKSVFLKKKSKISDFFA